MTISSLTLEIERDRESFKRLNAGRLRLNRNYAIRSRDAERILGLLADRIARLERFRSLLTAKAYCAGMNALDSQSADRLTVGYDNGHHDVPKVLRNRASDGPASAGA